MDDVLSVLCLLLGILVFITVVGHGLWVLAAAVFRAVSGEPPSQTAGKLCPQCGARSSVHGGRCVACGAVPAVAAGDSQREELRGTARQLWRMLEQGRITQRQYEELMVHVRADLARHGVAPPTEVVEAQVVEEPFAPTAGTKPGPGEAPLAPRHLEPSVPPRVAPSFAPAAARQEPRPPVQVTPAAPPPQPVFVEPPEPARGWADMLQSFMEESNVRWGEILAGLLIVICSIGLVVSIQATYKIPYFPAFVFTLFTVAFHGAGLYTLRRWKLEAVSRTILIISLLLVPLTFSAAVVMSGSGQEQRPVTDPLFLLAVTIGTVVFAWVSWSASRELVGEGAWRLAIAVLGCSLSQVLIQRVNLAGIGFWGLNAVAATPLAFFLVATVGQLSRGRIWRQVSRRRASQTFLVLGVAAFAFLAPLALLLVRAEPRWLALSWLSPLLSLAAATVLALGLLIHRRATARDLATVQTAGTAVLICGGMLMLLLVVLAWPEPELLCAVGIVNCVVLAGLAVVSRLPLLHAPAIACAALAAVMGLHLAQGRFADRESLGLQIIEASLMARSSLVLTILAAVAGALGIWQRREKREEWLVYLGGAGVLAALSIAIAAVAGFIPIRGWQQDADLAGPILVLYALGFIAAGPLTPWPAVAAAGSFLLWAGLVQLLRLNITIRGALDSQGLLPDRPVLVATLWHALLTAVTAAIATGREVFAPREDFRRFEHTLRGEQLVLPLAAGAIVSLALLVPLLLWRFDQTFLGHGGYALAAAVAWGAAALAMRWKWAVSGMQAMLALAPALVIAGGWMRREGNDWLISSGHVQGQLVLLAYGAVVWSLARRLSSDVALAREMLHARWPAVDQMLLVLATVVLPLWTLLVSVPAMGWELGFDAAGGARPLQLLLELDGRGWLVLAAVLAAIGISLWERVSAAGLVSLGVASFAAVWLAAGFWHETSAVASAARWAAGLYAVVWALPFLFREQVRAAGKRLVWLRWEKLPRQLTHWFCAQPLVLGGTTVLIVTIVAVAQNAGGASLRGPAPPSIYDWMGPTAAYAAPLLALVAVLLAYAVREREPGFAMGGSAVFQLAINLAFILHVSLAEQTLRAEIRAIEWFQWNAASAGIYALVWLGLSPWIMPRQRQSWASGQSAAGAMLTLQTLAGGVLLAVLVGWAVFAVVESPRLLSAEAVQLGRWLSYLAAAAVLAAIGWHSRGRLRSGWGDIGVWLAFALVAFVACSLDPRDSTRVWLAYHTLTAGWLAIGLAATAAIVAARWEGEAPAEPSPRPLVGALNRIAPHHLSAAAIGALVTFLAIRGSVPDPGEPWWSLAASLGPLVMATALGLVRRSQPYAYASVVLAGLTAVLLLVAPSVATHLPQVLGRPPLAAVDVVAVAALLATGLWLAAEIRFQLRQNESLDSRWLGPRVHALALVSWVAVLLPWQLFLLVPLDWIETIGAKAVVAADVVLLGVLLIATLWDRRAWWSLPATFAWGAASWTLAVNLLAERFGLQTGERYALLGLAAALHLALAGQLWSYGANLSVIGTRLGVSDPIGGLKRTEWWLPPVILALAAGVCLAQLFFTLGLDRPELRVAAALSPAIAAWGVLCLAQEKRRDALQLTSLLMAGLAAVYLGWAQLDPREPAQAWGLTRAFRLLMVLSALTFAYGLALPRWLLTSGSWNSSVRKAGHFAGVSAIASFLAVLVLEVMLFRPGVDAPIDGVQVGAIAVVLLALIAGLLSLALLPGRDPLTLSETGRQWYVYAAEATAALLFAHLYICRPTWFDGILRPYWPLIIMGIAFAGVGLSELCHRFKIRVLAEPLERTGALLPLLPVLTAWTAYAQTDYSLVLLVVGILYLVLSVTRKSWASLIAAAVAGNGALWVLLHKQDLDVTQNPQLWLIPPALSVLAAAQLNKHRLPAPTLAAIRYLATIVIYLSSTSEIFIRGVGDSLWPPMILATLSVAGALLGIMLRIRAFLYLGTSFTVLALGTMVAHAARAIDHVWPWWAFGIGLGIALLVLFGIFEKKRPEVLDLIGRLRKWEQ